MVSDEHLKILEGKGIEFITALDGNQLDYFETDIDFDIFMEVKELDQEHDSETITEILLNNGFLSERSDLYYKEIILSESEITEIERKTKKLALRHRRYFLAFNPILAYLTEKHRKERVEEFNMLSYLIEITILNKIRSSKKVDNMSLETIFNQLAKCKQHIIKLKEGNFISRITTVDKKLEKILKELGCSYLVAPSFLTRKGIVT